MFDVILIHLGRVIHSAFLPFLPRKDDHILAPSGKTYIVTKAEVDLSSYVEASGAKIPAKVFVRAKTDSDF